MLENVRKLRKNDFPELEGKEVRYILGKNSNNLVEYDCKAIVAGCCRVVGITIVNQEDKDRRLYCLNFKEHGEYPGYNQAFDEAVRSIRRGKVDGLKLMRIRIGDDKLGLLGDNQAPCAFGE